MFSKKQRLDRNSFSLVYKNSKSFVFEAISFRLSFKNKGQKFAVVLPGSWNKEKFLKNRTKRRLIKAIKDNSKFLPKDLSLICFAKKESKNMNYGEIVKATEGAFKVIVKSFPTINK